MYRHQSTSSDYSVYSDPAAESRSAAASPDLSFYSRPAHASPRTRRSLLGPILARQNQAWSFPALEHVDLCFCGKPADAEEDSIYCSVVCGRKDAMDALCAQEEEFARTEKVEEVQNQIGMIGLHAGGEAMARGGSAGSHYRRVEMAEAKKEAEKAVSEGREAITGVWRYQKSKNSSAKPTPVTTPLPSPLPSPALLLPSLPLAPQSYANYSQNSIPPSSISSRPMQRAATHAPSASTSTTGSTVPSFTSSNGSSRHSYSSSLDSSIYDPTPLSAQPYYTIPKIHYDRYEKVDEEINAHQSPFRFPSSPGSDAHIEILDSFYLEKSPTPTVVEKKKPGTATGFMRAMFQDSDEGDGAEEGRDSVASMMPRRDRSQRRTHQKGKLSFDDVVNLMKA